MTSPEFCVVCGRTDRPVSDGVCAECAARSIALVVAPARPTIVLCPTCGAREVRQHWERSGSSRLLTAEDLNPLLTIHPEVALRRVRWEETGQNPMLRQYHGVADVRFREIERSVPVDMTVKVEHQTCPECSRRAGHYYTAILQLRGSGDRGQGHEPAADLRERLERRWEELLPEARVEWRKAISWREALPEGWDYYLTDTLAARALARLFKQKAGAQLKESATLVGRRHGEDLYRVTFCVRLPGAGSRERPRSSH